MIHVVTDEQNDRSRDAAESDSPPAAESESRAAPGSDSGNSEREARRGGMTVADYERAMSERNQHARARGLSAPFIPGGEDPDPEATRRREQPYVRLLVLMVAAIIIGGFALSIIGLVVLGNGAPP